jgi:serine/threonine-protein kinase
MAHWQPGEVLLNKYEIVRPLGSGGFGSAYQVRHVHLPGCFYVIKRLHDQLITDPEALRRFRREAQKLLRLKGSQNVVAIHDLEELDGVPLLVMNYVDGQPLKAQPVPYPDIPHLLREGGRPDVRDPGIGFRCRWDR